ncbi:MAG: FG-GAP-like repeat-containing protein [Nanoarchaeota archaeon]|nr:FG-GAP-like repeat-containing protein [Nanoarchaeota archaeon]
MKKIFFVFFVVCMFAPMAFAADQFKPYLHTATVPEAPKLNLYGQYQTNLYAGAATYSYGLSVPKGTNNLQPSLVLSYSSQAIQGMPSIVGAGWSLSDNFIQRDNNGTLNNLSDDYFILNMEGNQHYLRSTSLGNFSTQVDSYFKIQNISYVGNDYDMYWLVTKKDGTQYRFGYNTTSSELAATSHVVQWKLDRVEDTFGNVMSYSYTESDGVAYLSQIDYEQRKVTFNYDNNRSDFRPVYVSGLYQNMSKRLSSVSVFSNDELVRRYDLTYTAISSGLTSLQNITYLGDDNSSRLHTISFDYYSSAPGFWQRSTHWPSPIMFTYDAVPDTGARMVDVNNDGFVDIAYGNTTTQEKKVYLNDKISGFNLSSWVLPHYFIHSDGTDNGVRFVDVNNDGYTDLLRARDGTRQLYLNNGTAWNLTSSWTIPVDFWNSGEGQGILISDVNNDGYQDILQSNSQNNRHVYLHNRSSSWKEDTSWYIPVNFTAASADTGVRLIDVNGDGLPDILHSDLGKAFKKTYLHNGSGWTETTAYFQIPSYFTGTSNEDYGVRFIEVNGDGLIDIISDRNENDVLEKTAWLNNGSGWAKNNSWINPNNFVDGSFNGHKRIVDVNGDGMADLMQAKDGVIATWIRNQTYQPVLLRVQNEYGGVMVINYTDSTSLNNSLEGYSTLGFNIKVVKNITGYNGMNGDFALNYSTRYNYSGGSYSFDFREFRGFAKVAEQTLSAVVTHYFHQDDALKGKEFKTEVTEGKNYSMSVKGFKFTNSSGVFNVTLEFSSTYRYDGSEIPVVVNTSYVYDRFGNVISVTSLGDVGVVGDERFTNYTYVLDDIFLDKVSSSKTLDNNSVKIKESKFYYDGLGLNGIGLRGALSKKEDWDDNGNNSFVYFDYDEFGNVKRQTDSLGNSMSYSYDGTHVYPVTIVNALGHVMTYEYDVGTGNLLSEKKNGIETSYQYDVFGRITKEIRPYDSSSLPTKKYNYSMDGVAPEIIKVTLKTTANKTNDVSYYYDGFAQLVQLKTDVENSQQIVKNIFYDGLGRVKQEQNPYFATMTMAITSPMVGNYTFYTYDALDRVIGVMNSDGTTKNITFDRKNITDFDEKKNRHTYMIDGYDRIVNVYEFMADQYILQNETYVTTYEYDANDNLIKITDSQGNTFSFAYDSLNRKTEMRDPDLGRWMYGYDTNGNLVSQSGGGGDLISGDGFYREYDSFGQLSKIRTGSTNTSPVLEQYFYDADGQRIKIWKNDSANTTIYTPFRELMRIVNLTGSYEFTYIYDGDTQVARKNPDGSIQYDHTDHLGSVGVLTNSTGGILENTLYAPYGEELSGGNMDFKGYTGQFDDEATGQMYYGARYYKPGIGIFISPDSLIQNAFDPQFLNHYSYVRNNPYAYIDPNGKNAIIVTNYNVMSHNRVTGIPAHEVIIVGNEGSYTLYSYSEGKLDPAPIEASNVNKLLSELNDRQSESQPGFKVIAEFTTSSDEDKVLHDAAKKNAVINKIAEEYQCQDFVIGTLNSIGVGYSQGFIDKNVQLVHEKNMQSSANKWNVERAFSGTLGEYMKQPREVTGSKMSALQRHWDRVKSYLSKT